jgi:hypothetical protein
MSKAEHDLMEARHENTGRYLVGVWVVLCLIVLTGIVMAITAFPVRAADPLPMPNRIKDGANNFCIPWAQQAVYGAAKFLKNKPDMQAKDLHIVFQTHEEDVADPIDHPHMVINGEDVPTSFIVLTGQYDNGQKYELNEENKVWVVDAMRGGWRWARQEVHKGRTAELSTIDSNVVIHELFDFCVGQKEVSNGRFIHTASNQHLVLEHQPVANNEFTKRDLCTVKGMTADDVLGRRAAGQPYESLLAELDATKMTVPQRAEQVELLDAAYAWKGTRAAFVHEVYSTCMH